MERVAKAQGEGKDETERIGGRSIEQKKHKERDAGVPELFKTVLSEISRTGHCLEMPRWIRKRLVMVNIPICDRVLPGG